MSWYHCFRQSGGLARAAFACALLFIATATQARANTECSTAAQPTVWQCWEHALTSTRSQPYADPYHEVKLKIKFTRTGQKAFESYAFWSGPGWADFKFRAAFPTTSTTSAPWKWTAICEAGCNGDGGLDGKTGNTLVTAYSGTNLLYKHGFLKASGHAIFFNDATPFLWIGDTAWSALIRSTAADWDSYLSGNPSDPSDSASVQNSRKNKGFTVIQVAAPVDWMRVSGQQPTDSDGQTPFNGCTASTQVPDVSCHWNPAFWTTFAKKIQSANDQGFVVVVVGLMERIIESMSAYPSINESTTFARTLVASLAGNFVIFSPGFDRDPTDSGITNRINQVGTEILNASHVLTSPITPRHLITNHFAGTGNRADQIIAFQNQPWLSFQMYQSGQAARRAQESVCVYPTQQNLGNPNRCTQNHESQILAEQLRLITQRPRDMAWQIWGATTVKPVVNGEAIYEGAAASCKLCPSLGLCPGNPCPVGTTANYERHYSADRARQAAYLSFLAGANGYTLGAKGVFGWDDWYNGIRRSSANHMKQLRAILLNVTWSTLKSADGKIQNQASEEHLKMAVGETADLRAAVAYLPDAGNDRIQLGVSTWTNFESWATKLWFNPQDTSQLTVVTTVTGSCSSLQAGQMCCTGAANARSCTFLRPAAIGDWVLVLRRSPTPPATGIPALQTWVGLDPLSEVPAVYAQLQAADGSLVGDPFQVSDPTDLADKGKPRAAREREGRFMVVWESTGTDGTGAQIQAQRVSAGGKLLEATLRVDAGTATRQADPDVAATPAGGFVVAWASGDGETGLGDIHARLFNSAGEGLDELRVTEISGPHNAPLVTTNSAGDFAVAWEESIGETAGPGAVLARLYGNGGVPLGGEFSTALIGIDQLGNPYWTNALVSAELADSGDLAVTWGQADTTENLTGIYSQAFSANGSPTNDVLTVWSPDGGSAEF